ncbi:hypothetical protein J0A67_02405 [Algoriphagus aestuariicola]|jgi:hypothetical protein|uniref:Uncharacterized protein n=1 Tax=Algoriphagus aestuariicola TaxID=1852016 RepID=A0ABS3BK60_9BACT|nr:hypothetical protein [Algoriphagus aestuariicola]MBN7799690.1 hypothetical protein [Algoriphagus aestuariicola]
MILEDKEVSFIKGEIEKSKISISELKDDLLDHFCCFIENELNKGRSFESSYVKALNHICPDGFDEIQKETIYLLNSKKIIAMKRIMYLIGLLASMSMTLGWLFKYLNWKGGGDMLTYGMIFFLVLFLPMLAINRYKMTLSGVLSEKLKIIFGFSGAIVTGLGVILRTSGMQYGTLIVIVGALIIAFGFLPFLFFRMYRKSIEQI